MKIIITHSSESFVEGIVKAVVANEVEERVFTAVPDESLFGIPFTVLRDNGVGEFTNKEDA